MHPPGHDPIQFVIDQARRRVVWNETLAQLIVALSVCCGAAIVLLLVGTQLLEWYWGVLLVASVFGFTLWRVRARIPSAYEIAQKLDARLALHDSLSTAWYFLNHPERHATKAVAEQQHAMAAESSRTVDVRAAVPLIIPRTAYLLFTLFAATSLLFGVRYGMRRELDIRAPLVQVFYDVFGGRLETRAALNRKQPSNRNPWEAEPQSGIQAEEKRFEDEKQLDAAPDKVLDTIEVPEVDNDRTGTEQGKGKQGQGQSPEGDPLDGESGEGADTGREGDKDQQGEAGKEGESSDGENGSKTAPNNMNDNSSLAQKFRDALANLMSKMKPQTGQSQSKQSQAGNQSQQSASQQGSQGKQQAQNKNGGEQGGEGEEGEANEQGEGQKSEGSGKGKSAEQASSQTPGSGMGKQDGDKDVKAAEQLEAMGKISEILGKRSQNVTGEMTIEVQQSKQGIRTPYSPSSTAHSQAGTEIRRDEVPPALQHYVQQYFEKVRKQQK